MLHLGVFKDCFLCRFWLNCFKKMMGDSLKPKSHRLAEKNAAAGDQDAFSKLKPPDLPHFGA